MESRLLEHYKTQVRPRLAEKFQWTNPNQIPKIQKVVMNVGVGEASKNAKLLTAVVDELGVITGQKAVEGEEIDLELPTERGRADWCHSHSQAEPDV